MRPHHRHRRKTIKKKKIKKRRCVEGGGGGISLPPPPVDPENNPYTIEFFNPTSLLPGYKEEIGLTGSPQFQVAATTAGPATAVPAGTYYIKIDNNYAFKFFFLKTAKYQKWYVMLDTQVLTGGNKSNGDIYEIKPDVMIKTTLPNVIQFNPIKVVKFDASKKQYELDKTQHFVLPLGDKYKDPILIYLNVDTQLKGGVKEEANWVAVDTVGAVAETGVSNCTIS